MTSEQLLDRVTIDSTVCHGKPCIHGTRVLVTVVLDALAAGMSAAEIVEHYPTLTIDDVRAAAAYGAWLAKQVSQALSATSRRSSSTRTSPLPQSRCSTRTATTATR